MVETAGIITMEDIVEEIFGEIEDEHDKEETTEKLIEPGVYEFSARLEIDYLNEKFDLDLPADDEQYDTLGGLILYLYGDIPEENELIQCGSYNLTPIQVGETRIELVRLEIQD
jgi:putative hemolysin